MIPLLTLALRAESDVVVARQRARQLASHLGFDVQDQARIATAVSQLARNVTQHAGRGRIEFALEVSDTGIGLGLALSRRLAEVLGGTITVESALRQGSTLPDAAEQLADALRRAGTAPAPRAPAGA